MIRSYRTLPEIRTGYTLDDVFAVIVPVARTNIVANPSFETNTTSWTAIGGSIARSTTYQYHGAYSLAITPTSATTDGARYDTVSLTSGTTYAYSAKVRGVAGLKYKLAIETTGGVELASVTFTATGRWQWVYGYYTETSSTTRRVTVRKASHASTALFYLDGVQVEAIAGGETVSTYIDGDQTGLVTNQSPAAYLWIGTPHASQSSRSGLTRAGGMVVPMKKFQFLLTAIIGLGLAAPQNNATEYAMLDGGYPDFTRKPTRQFSLTGQFQARTYQQLRDLRGSLASLLDRDLIGLDQVLVLRHHLEDARGTIMSDAAIIPAKYAGGLSGNTDNHYAETAAISFTQYLPYVQSEREAGASLSVQQSIANANRVAIRSASGVWSAIGTGGSGGGVYAIVRGNNGIFYIGGAFTSFNGVANTLAIVQYDPSSGTISAMGSGAGAGAVRDLLVAPNGDIWAVGSFTNMGGIAAADFVARWDGSAWNAVGTPPVAANQTTVAPSTFGATGSFYYPSGPSSTVRTWNGSAWSTLGTVAGSGAAVNCILRLPNGDLLIGGDFTSVNAVSATNVARYSISAGAWQAVSGTISEVVNVFALAPNGIVYAGTGVGGSPTLSALWAWNGSSWTRQNNVPIGGTILALGSRPDGTIAIGGYGFPTPSSTMIDQIGIWNGTTTTPVDIDLPGASAEVYRIWTALDDTMTIGYSTNGTATAAGVTTVTNAGTAPAYPTLTIKGPSSGTSRIYEIKNYTTGRAIYLDYTINTGETAILRFDPDNLSFTSDFQGNIASKILTGSNESDFFLQPGANSMSFFAADSTVTATLQWRPQFLSLDDVP